MKSMPPEELEKMMSQHPMPGVSKEMMKSQLETISKNPDLLQNAVDRMNSMPPEQREQMLASAGSGQAGAVAPSVPTDPGALSQIFDNPGMMTQVGEMMKNMSDEDLARMHGCSAEEAGTMRQAAEQMAANPELGKQMSDMMKNMPPEQLSKMMEMSRGMRGGGQDGAGGVPTDSAGAMGAMMSDPAMMKAAEDMMKNMSPEALASMARSSGLDVDEDKAKMITKHLPKLMMLMRWFAYTKNAVSSIFSRRGRMVLAVVILGVAMMQHYWWS